MIKIINRWLEAIREYPNLKVSFDYLHKEYNWCLEELKKRTNDLTSLGKEFSKAKEQQRKLMETKKDEKFFINKHPITNINYIRHETDGEYQVDVRAFCMPDYVYPIFTGTNDQKMWKILTWVIENIKYTSDTTEFKHDEYWAFPYQTLKHRKGDCEDGAILIWSIAMANDVPYYRVRLNAGWVKEPYGTRVGHAYVSYFRESDNKAVVLDWCYYPSYVKIGNRPTHQKERDYYEIWWSTDSKNSYGNKNYMETMPKENFKVVEE